MTCKAIIAYALNSEIKDDIKIKKSHVKEKTDN